MKHGAYQCCVCSRHYVASQINLIKLKYEEKSVKIEGNVDDWYSGIRSICHFCINGMKNLELDLRSGK